MIQQMIKRPKDKEDNESFGENLSVDEQTGVTYGLLQKRTINDLSNVDPHPKKVDLTIGLRYVGSRSENVSQVAKLQDGVEIRAWYDLKMIKITNVKYTSSRKQSSIQEVIESLQPYSQEKVKEYELKNMDKA
ncbi:hypothetical protein Tco_0455645 [Tanacetum coccineum]